VSPQARDAAGRFTSGGGGGVSVHFEGVDDFEKAVDALIAHSNVAVASFVIQGGHMIEAEAKARAPVQTGTLRRSIGVWEGPTARGLGTWSSKTYPTTVYSRRVELGFHGTDSLGRHYDQAGQPYLGPGLDAVRDRLGTLHETMMRAALGV
jgi:hypothetical protein